MLLNDYTKTYNEILWWSHCMPDPIKGSRYTPTVEEILVECSSITGISIEDIIGRGRHHDVCFARQLAQATLAIFKEDLLMGLVDIGNVFERDHSTILHSRKTISRYVEIGYRINIIEKMANALCMPTSKYRYNSIILN